MSKDSQGAEMARAYLLQVQRAALVGKTRGLCPLDLEIIVLLGSLGAPLAKKQNWDYEDFSGVLSDRVRKHLSHRLPKSIVQAGVRLGNLGYVKLNKGRPGSDDKRCFEFYLTSPGRAAYDDFLRELEKPSPTIEEPQPSLF